jgi:hypothetical protein
MIACNDLTSYLFRRMPEYDVAILRDHFPIDDAWVGHMKAMEWNPFSGTEHTYDQMHTAFPDLTGCWQPVNTNQDGCLTGPCQTPEKLIGWGSTRKTYGYEKASIRTNVLCFDEMVTRQRAKEQVSIILSGLREASITTQSDWMRRKALQENLNIYVAGSAGLVVPITEGMFAPDCTTIDMGSAGSLPTSMLTLPYLQRLVPKLKLDGYFKKQYLAGGMLKLITDEVTAFQLTNGNPQLIANYRYTDFDKGGALYKYGISTAVGNFGISYDFFPMRFEHIGGGVLQRVFPYTNGPATIGIQRLVSDAYINAPYQINYIWHPEAMLRLTPKMVTINPEMPFLNRDLAGKWMFVGPQSDSFVVTDPATGQQCTYDNSRRNLGFFRADFQAGIKAEYPQWTRPILSLRDPGCVTDMPRCTTIPSYTTQDNSAANALCYES